MLKRSAFTVVEVVVGIAIVTIVGALIVVSMSATDRASRVSDDIEVLRDLTEAISKFDTGTTVFPQSLLHLTTRPLATDLNSCSAAYGATVVTNWTNSGPFYSQPIGAALPLEVGSIQTTMTRIGATTPATTIAGILQISVTDVDIDDAIEINGEVDNDVVAGQASATGIVRFAAPVSGKTTMTWNMAVRGC